MSQPVLSPIGNFVIVSGLSGAGKSAAMDAFADLGFFTIENLPVALLFNFMEFLTRSSSKIKRAAVSVDTDTHIKREQLVSVLSSLGEEKRSPFVFFLDCSNEVIVKRYGQTRRPHPNFNPEKDNTLEDAINRERRRLSSIRDIASLVLDTSELNVHELRREVRTLAESLEPRAERKVRINFVSFGFKHGVPIDCDLLVDVRFLPNPYFVDELKDKTGLDEEVVKFVMAGGGAQILIDQYSGMLKSLLPFYTESGKSYLNIGVGCTGGKHRSVAVSERLADKLRNDLDPQGYLVGVKHRDSEKK